MKQPSSAILAFCKVIPCYEATPDGALHMARKPEWPCRPPGYTAGAMLLALLYLAALFWLLFWRLRAAVAQAPH